MERRPVLTFILLFLIILYPELYSQSTDSISFKMNSRLSFYSYEREAEMILEVPVALLSAELNITLTIEEHVVNEFISQPGNLFRRIPFNISIPAGTHKAKATIKISGKSEKKIYTAATEFILLKYKANEVKTDRLTGGMIVNKRPFFPFGFYCYSPVQSTLPEEEVVKGFNMISPYQKILPGTIKERKAYMDRCAQLGMKVHYNLLSVSGGGGVGSAPADISAEEKRLLLINEIRMFKDHPALLAWYIADEPTANGKKPDELTEIYNVIKENDPWHPISIVFSAPYLSSRNYAGALDIVMADPYPVPNNPVSTVGQISAQLNREFKGTKPVWFVPQAFGGSEWWEREPTIQEIRSMTYQSIIMGARGIQYFIRQGLNAFPKSTATWGECGKIAIEIAEITPWLLSDETTLPVQTPNGNVLITSELHNGKLLILAVNTINEPQLLSVKISGETENRAFVLFENRYVKINNGSINDYISSFGTQAYLIDIDIDIEIEIDTVNKTNTSESKNLILDPGFENIASPGIPSSCYARAGKDKGATFFLDSREHFEGDHSLRLITPVDKNGVKLTFFPVTVNPGSTYRLSVWAKNDPDQRFFPKRTFWDRLFGRKKPIKQYFELGLGSYGSLQFTPDSVWHEYVTYIAIPISQDTLLRTNPTLQMPGSGVAWFDKLQLIEDPLITSYIDPGTRMFTIKGSTLSDNIVLRYSTDGTTPERKSPELIGSVSISRTTAFKTGIFIKDTLRAVNEKSFLIHKAVAKNITYLTNYLSQYDGGGKYAPVDGIKGSPNHNDSKWQAYLGKDCELIIDMEEKTDIKKVTAGFLQNHSYWIFMPVKLDIYDSDDRAVWSLLGSAENNVPENSRGYIIRNFTAEFNKVTCRYIKVVAKSLKICPDWHSGRGKACYIFLDEIVVE